MRRRPPALAKTTRPSVASMLPRRRLFRVLDRSRSRPILWVSGPPGAGKTTLVASYLQARKLPCLWYQVDAGDADVASFFYYLRLAAAQAAPRRRTQLPLLTPEYLRGVATFARRFFRDLFGRLKSPCVLVLDNYQEVPADSAFHEVIREGLAELPPGGRAILISRADPPPALARLRASRAMAVLGWDELRLTREESHGLAQVHGRGRLPRAALRALHDLTEGWAAGLVLLLGRLETEGPVSGVSGQLAAEATFDYFASEIFRYTDPETRRLLLQTAFVPRMTARMADALTGSARAGRLLAELARRHYFIARRLQSEPVYEYHPLFRAFLLAQARETLAPAQQAQVQRVAARLLEAAGQVEDAAGLLQEAGDWQGLAQLVLQQAPGLLAQGRGQTLEAWLRGLPEPVLDESPWLRYWLGACRLTADPLASLPHFERACAGFRDRGDEAGMLLAWSGAADARTMGYEKVTSLDPWIADLETRLARTPTFPSPEIEARVTCSMLAALVLRRPYQPEMALWTKRAEAVLAAGGDIALRLVTGFYLTVYHVWMGEVSKAAGVFRTLHDISRSRGAPPMARIAARYVQAHTGWLTADFEACRQAVAEGLEIAWTAGVRALDSQLAAIGLYGALSAGDLATAAKLLREMQARLEAARSLDASHYQYVAAWNALLRGDMPAALRGLEEALELTIEAGAPFPIALSHLAMAQLRCERAEPQQAAEHLAQARRIAGLTQSRLLEYMRLLVEAQLALDRGEEAAGLAALGEAMTIGREQGYVNFPWWRARTMTRLCLKALEAGIEIEYVQRLVRTRGLVPETPPLEVDAWPWAVRIATLGRFEVQVDGRPLTFSGKAQKKPLALLKALVALGGRQVRDAALAEALWPDAEGDAAQQALATTLHRLRRLLGREAALLRREAQLNVDPRYVWVDTWALERRLARAEEAATLEARARLLDAALRLYQGPFLPADADQPWTTALRERLLARLRRALEALGRQWEQAGRWEPAAACYQRALDLDDCAEGLYRRLMALYQRMGRRAEALALYERCRQRLAAVLGVEPAPETQALHRALRAGPS